MGFCDLEEKQNSRCKSSLATIDLEDRPGTSALPDAAEGKPPFPSDPLIEWFLCLSACLIPICLYRVSLTPVA